MKERRKMPVISPYSTSKGLSMEEGDWLSCKRIVEPKSSEVKRRRLNISHLSLSFCPFSGLFDELSMEGKNLNRVVFPNQAFKMASG